MTVSLTPPFSNYDKLQFTQSDLQDGISFEELKAAMARAGIRGPEAAGLVAMFRLMDRTDGDKNNSVSTEQLTAFFEECGSSEEALADLNRFYAITQGDKFLQANWITDPNFLELIFRLTAGLESGSGSSKHQLTTKEFKEWLNSLNLTNSQKNTLIDAFEAFEAKEAGGVGDGIIKMDEFIQFMKGENSDGTKIQQLFVPTGSKALNGRSLVIDGDKPTKIDDPIFEKRTYLDKLFTSCSTGMYMNADEFGNLFKGNGPLSKLSPEEIASLKDKFAEFLKNKDFSKYGATREQFQQFWATYQPQ